MASSSFELSREKIETCPCKLFDLFFAIAEALARALQNLQGLFHS
jgi:hypothetical protein